MLSISRQLWIDSSAGVALPAAAEKKEADFFAEHTQVVQRVIELFTLNTCD